MLLMSQTMIIADEAGCFPFLRWIWW